MNWTIAKKMLATGIAVFIGLGALGLVINQVGHQVSSLLAASQLLQTQAQNSGVGAGDIAVFAENLERINSTLLVGYIVLILAIVLILPALYLLTRNIVKPMKNVVAMVRELNNGHLGQQLNLNRSDELGILAGTLDDFAVSMTDEIVQPLKQLVDGDMTFQVYPKDENDLLRETIQHVAIEFSDMIRQIQSASEQISVASGQVSNTMQTQAEGASKACAALEEISSSVQELSSQTQLNADNSNEANQLASVARETADKGGVQMQAMVTAMAEINAAGENINKIIKVIDEIAFQTNLLALNAAVEAARAGQHGKGFAVVAEEVRNLAARSAKAAHETAELIKSSVEKSENGTTLAEQTSGSFTEIVTAVTKVTDLIAEIAAASQDQARGIEQVNQTLYNIDQGVQADTANAEEGAAAAEELSTQAAHLQDMLGRFSLMSAAQVQLRLVA